MLSSSVQMLQHLVHGKVITLLKQVAQTWLEPESSSRFGGDVSEGVGTSGKSCYKFYL